MKPITRLIACFALLAIAAPAFAQDDTNDSKRLKLAALEALISAPPERALPLAEKALKGDHSDEVKERALFVLSQIDQPEAQNLLLDTARQGDGELRHEAIRMIGIGGDEAALAELGTLYSGGDEDFRDAVLEAYLIAGDKQAVYTIAADSNGEDEAAVEMLAAMGATEELRQLRETFGMSESLIEAAIISDDASMLRDVAFDSSDIELQKQAIEALGVIGGSDVNATLVEIYRGTDSEDVRHAALEGMLISGHDEGVLELYRAADNDAEKKELLEFLVMMGSDEVWDLIDSAFDGGL
ncbi:MAG: HEAT repeat domain-containing protein [Woeseiaceae bacterium]|nr:HEAT repeat domain-containing protein [Woeseiaceae bacterium]